MRFATALRDKLSQKAKDEQLSICAYICDNIDSICENISHSQKASIQAFKRIFGKE